MLDKQEFLDKYKKLSSNCQSDLLKYKGNGTAPLVPPFGCKFLWSYYAGMGSMSVQEVSEEDVPVIEELIEDGSLIKGDDWAYPMLVADCMSIVIFERYKLND